MENEEIMMNETTEAMTDVEEPITETETNEEESGSNYLLLAAGAAGCAAAIYGICKFGEKHIVPHAVNGFNKICNWVENLKGKKTVEAEAEEVDEDTSEE